MIGILQPNPSTEAKLSVQRPTNSRISEFIQDRDNNRYSFVGPRKEPCRQGRAKSLHSL